MRILIVVPQQNRATGNWVTAHRFRHGLKGHGHEVGLCGTSPDGAGLREQVGNFAPQLVILLHAYRTGRPWLETFPQHSLPFIVVLTGTDVHGGLRDPEQKPWIERVFAQAAAIVTQNRLTFAGLQGERPGLKTRLHYLEPGIELGAAAYALRQQLGTPKGLFLFLCPASLRPVKGVLDLLLLFDPLARRREDFHVVFCGPALDADYGRRFLAAVAARPWAAYIGIIPTESMAAAMGEADVILNNSVSEGLPNVLLEATALGRPILARNIPGNAAVVESGKNGLLYGDAAGFLKAAARLLNDPDLLRSLSHPQPERYAPYHEAAVLNRLCLQVAANSTDPAL